MHGFGGHHVKDKQLGRLLYLNVFRLVIGTQEYVYSAKIYTYHMYLLDVVVLSLSTHIDVWNCLQHQFAWRSWTSCVDVSLQYVFTWDYQKLSDSQ